MSDLFTEVTNIMPTVVTDIAAVMVVLISISVILYALYYIVKSIVLFDAVQNWNLHDEDKTGDPHEKKSER